jgi:hypothetical protein
MKSKGSNFFYILKDDEYDYYDDVETEEPKSKLARKQIIANTRDWLVRGNPDTFFGFSAFFPVWAVVMFSISGII